MQRDATSTVGAVEITLQYFDGCPSWMVVAERLAIIAAERPGMTVTRRLVETPEDAEHIGFVGSPSILVDGIDAFPSPSASVGLACRIYATPNGPAGAPTLDQLRAALPTATEVPREAAHEPSGGAADATGDM